MRFKKVKKRITALEKDVRELQKSIQPTARKTDQILDELEFYKKVKSQCHEL